MWKVGPKLHSRPLGGANWCFEDWYSHTVANTVFNTALLPYPQTNAKNTLLRTLKIFEHKSLIIRM